MKKFSSQIGMLLGGWHSTLELFDKNSLSNQNKPRIFRF